MLLPLPGVLLEGGTSKQHTELHCEVTESTHSLTKTMLFFLMMNLKVFMSSVLNKCAAAERELKAN